MGGWNHGLCGCFNNFGICIEAFFCPCYTHGRNAGDTGGSCCCCCCLFFVPFVNWFAICDVRGKVRAQRSIGGGGCGDCCATIWCPFCVIVQSAQEVRDPQFHAVVVEQQNITVVAPPQQIPVAGHPYAAQPYAAHPYAAQPYAAQPPAQPYAPPPYDQGKVIPRE